MTVSQLFTEQAFLIQLLEPIGLLNSELSADLIILTRKLKQALVQQSLSQIAPTYSIQSQLYFHGITQLNLSCIEAISKRSILTP